MLRFICIFLLLVGSNCASAQIPSREKITEFIWSGQDATARTAIQASVSEYDSGNITADEVRDVFIGLSRSHPKTRQFIQRWLAQEPDNPLPNIARAWALWSASGTLGRGSSERSVQLAWDLYYQARDHATRAYKAKPDLIPASDAVIRGLAEGVGMPDRHAEVRRILGQDPNWGSLLRYVTSFANEKVYYSDFLDICTSLSLFFPADAYRDTVQRCIMTAGVNSSFAWLNEYGRLFFRSNTSPDMAITNVYTFATKVNLKTAKPDDVLWAHDVVLNAEFDQFSLPQLRTVAVKLAQSPTAQELHPNTRSQFLLKHLERAQSLLKADPFNEDLISFVREASDLAWSQEYAAACGREVGERGCVLTFEEQQPYFAKKRKQHGDIVLARLKSNPWAPENWANLANHLYRDPVKLFDGDLALENAVALSDDPLNYVNQILARKTVQFSALQDIEYNLDTATAEYINFFQETNVASQVLCPFLRADRYRAFLCEFTDNQACTGFDIEDEAMIATWDILRALAENEPACQSVLASSGTDLGYSMRPYKDVFDGAIGQGQLTP